MRSELEKEWDAKALKLGKLNLRFTSDETERHYRIMHIRQSLPTIWLSILAGMFLYAVFGILDLYVVPDKLTEIWTIRYAIVCPILIGAFLVTLTKYFIRVSQVVLALGMLVPGLGILGMVAVANTPGNHLYYAGLILVIIYCSSLSVLRYVYAAAVSVTLLLIYQYVALVINPIPSETLINNNFFLIVSLAVGVFTSYTQELYIRQNFVNTQLLLREKGRTDQLLDEARASNQAKTEFLAVMSHELRTPLNAIIGFSEVIKQQMFGPVGSKKYLTYIDDIYNSGTHLLGLITDILDLSKAEAGRLVLRDEVVNLTEVLDGCLRMFRERAAETGVRLQFDMPGVATQVRADPRLLRQSFINLISNAVKFTQKGGSVLLSIGHAENGGVHVRVEDSGIGIAEGDLKKVVEPFVQVQSALTRDHEGTGLGLPLAKKIMELHEGSLAIESEIGTGTVVTAILPAKRVIPKAGPPSLSGDAA
ncbi:MAG: HAMP domain-containing histidine kinase [Alphaproteobacteria bacterium]|nr:HAMP domain-containing histidine kinase [Alphaproteobacteria bacterium]